MAEKEKAEPTVPEKVAAGKPTHKMLENIRFGLWLEAGTKQDLLSAGVPKETIAEWLQKKYIEAL